MFPEKFKTEILLPILKPGKDASKVSSYRLIALLSCLGKEIEKLALKRLYAFIETVYLSSSVVSGLSIAVLTHKFI